MRNRKKIKKICKISIFIGTPKSPHGVNSINKNNDNLPTKYKNDRAYSEKLDCKHRDTHTDFYIRLA